MDLSILIPSRNEMFLSRTIEDILEHIEGDTEIICVLDGEWADPPIEDNPRVTLVYHPKSIGQRAATNEAARLAMGKYVMKVDAHCAFDQGFDVKLMADMQDNWTMVPIMRNLHVFDWVCPNGHRRYQSRTGPCEECGEPTTRDIVWIAKTNPQSTSYCFDPEPHFQYFRGFKKRPEGKGEITETMSLQGSCFMITKDKYFELNICDEAFGSWGSQGIEVACKTWLSGGRVVVNHRTWYGHLFRTQGGDFGFPYRLSKGQVGRAKRKAHEMFLGDAWPQQTRPLSWLVERFWPVPGWTDEDLVKLKGATLASKAILYYTCNTHLLDIEMACRQRLLASKENHTLVSVSREPIEFGEWNIVVEGDRGPETMHRQILAGLERIEAGYVFLCESDVLYHRSHFDFVPPRDDVFYFNTNVWKVWYDGGPAVWTDDLQQVSGICASRELLLDFYRKRVKQIEEEGFNRHYEPGNKQAIECKTENWMSEYPNVDIRHGKTLTRSKRSPGEFRNKKYAKGWKETDVLLGWGEVVEIVKSFSRDDKE